MRHVNQILNQTPDDKVVPEDANERRKFYDGIAAKLQSIQRLQQDPAYKLFLEEMERDELQTMDRLESVTEPVQLAKVAGVLLAIRGLKTWAADKVADLSDILESQNTK